MTLTPGQVTLILFVVAMFGALCFVAGWTVGFVFGIRGERDYNKLLGEDKKPQR